MAEEIRDVTVSIKLDTKQVDQQETKTKKIFDTTNEAIRKQINNVGEIRKDLAFMIRERNRAFDPKRIKLLNNEISQTQDRLKKVALGTKEVNNKFKGLIDIAKKLGLVVGIAFAVRSIIRFGKESVKAFDAQAKAVSRLRIALGDQERIQGALIQQAKQLQEITIFSDEDVIAAQATIAAFTQEEEVIKELTRVTLDFATAKGFELPAAAELVTKTFASSTNSLTRYGIQVKGAAGSTKRLESVVTNLDAAFKGQAEGATAGAGGLQQLNNQFIDFQEFVGGALIEGNFFIDILTGLLTAVNILIDPTRALGEELKEIVTVSAADQKAFEETLGRGIRIAEEQNKLLSMGVLISEEEQKAIEARVDLQIELEALQAAEAEANVVRLGNLFEVEEAIKALREEQKLENTTRERVLQINGLLIPLEEERLILTGKQTQATKDLKKAQDELNKSNEKARTEIFKAIEEADKRIEKLQIENIDNDLKRQVKLLEFEERLAIEAIENGIQSEEQKAQEILQIQEQFQKEFLELQSQAAEDSNAIREQDKLDAIANAQARQQAIDGFVQQGFDIFKDLQQRQTTIRLENLEKQGLSEEEFETRKKQILRQNAEQQKALSVFEIVVATAKAVTQALAVPPSPNIPLAVLAGALGAAQLAIVATTPIPQFAEGTLDAPGGLSLVGERGRELTYVPSGAKVLPNDKTEKYAGVIDSMFRNKFDQYIMERYIPDMVMTSTETPIYNDHRLRGTIRSNRPPDAEAIGRAVAKHTSREQKYLKWYA